MGTAFSRVLLLAVTTAIPFTVASSKATDVTDPNSAEQAVRKLNEEEVGAFLHKDPDTMARLWPDDFVVTNPLNNFVNKQQVLGMMKSGFLIITSYDRKIEYLRVYDSTVIVAGTEAGHLD